jgi:hypothetical protein
MRLTAIQIKCLQKGYTGKVIPTFNRGGHLFKGNAHRATINSLVKHGLLREDIFSSSHADVFVTTPEGVEVLRQLEKLPGKSEKYLYWCPECCGWGNDPVCLECTTRLWVCVPQAV